MGAIVGCLTVAVFISESQSLKDKRRVFRRLKDRLHQEFHVAVAETGGQELWQAGEISIVAVSNDRQQVDRTLSSVADWIGRENGFAVTHRHLEWR